MYKDTMMCKSNHFKMIKNFPGTFFIIFIFCNSFILHPKYLIFVSLVNHDHVFLEIRGFFFNVAESFSLHNRQRNNQIPFVCFLKGLPKLVNRIFVYVLWILKKERETLSYIVHQNIIIICFNQISSGGLTI